MKRRDGTKPRKQKGQVLSLYGNISIPRGYCKSCETSAFIIEGCYACCGQSVECQPKKFKRESEPALGRKRPCRSEQVKILKIQEHCCIYCGTPFNALRLRNGRPMRLKLNWDHRLPYVFSQNNYAYNFVAACHVCNGIKSSHVYRDLEEAQIALLYRRKQKGYDF